MSVDNQKQKPSEKDDSHKLLKKALELETKEKKEAFIGKINTPKLKNDLSEPLKNYINSISDTQKILTQKQQNALELYYKLYI
jgi:hypothetical protein